MNQERLMKVLVGPVISEKSTMVAEKHNQVSFVVVPNATKTEVKAAVEMLFNVHVNSVQILNLKGKQSASAVSWASATTFARRSSPLPRVKKSTSRKR